MEVPPRSASSRSWSTLLLVMAVLVGILVALQLGGMRTSKAENMTRGPAPVESLLEGDLDVKQAITSAQGAKSRSSAREAIRNYSEAIPWPEAYRCIGVAKQTLLKESGAAEFDQLASTSKTSKVSKYLDTESVSQLKAESRMWHEIYGSATLDPARARRFVSRIKSLNLGPLKQLAIADVYARSGQKAKAVAVLHRARIDAKAALAAFYALGALRLLAGLVGFALIFSFIGNYTQELGASRPPRIGSDVLIECFIVYLVGSLVLGAGFGVALATWSESSSSTTSAVAALVLDMAASLGAYLLATYWLRMLARDRGEDPGEISRHGRLWWQIKWGIGGYCATLPLLMVASAMSELLSNTVFKHVRTPEHPTEALVAHGGVVFVVVLIAGVIVAPVVEETAFRGMLYNALRRKMGVWSAAVLSAVVFALVHPTLPGAFLPIVALGIVLALLRERTGSLVPSMVCHALNNAVMFVILYMQS